MRYGAHPLQKLYVRKCPIAWVNRPSTDIQYKSEFLKDEFIKSLINLGFIPMSIADETGKIIYKIQGYMYPTNPSHYVTNFSPYHDSFVSDTIPRSFYISTETVKLYFSGLGHEGIRTNGGPNEIRYKWNTRDKVFKWSKGFGVLHNTNGPAKVTNYKTVEYWLNGEPKTLTEFKREYMITHLEEYKKPDLEIFCNR